ncbi:TPA: DUF4198 domain-containing protein [Candidatus Poribacteria bacterium]|nr:DUF4198 domain-containing protein [Candidatus Poribacteria bacterium]
MRLIGLLLTVIVAGLISTPVYAHYLWLNVDNYYPKAGEEVTFSIGWGHKFPEDSQPRAEMVEKLNLYLIEPEGKKLALEIKAKGEEGVEPIKVKLGKPGTYLAVLTRATFSSKTTEGYFYKPKNQLKNVLKSSWSETVAKAVVTAGSPEGETFKKEVKQRYQIIPLQNPAELKVDDYLPVKILLDGKPYRTWVYATYAGFSAEGDTFAYTTRADKEGIAKVRILKSGVWLIKVSDEIPYPNPKEADNYSFKSTLTFEIK